MGLQTVPAYIAQTGYQHPATLDRNLLEGLFQRSGALRLGDFVLSVGVGTRAIAIAPGRYFVLGVENAQQGGYFAWSDATETVLLASTGSSRIDTILLRIYDDQYGVISGSPRAQIDVVQGVTSGSPVARPDSDFNVGGSFYVPGAWARLGDVRVNSADTGSIPAGQITTANRYVRMPGGATICGSTTRPSDPQLFDEIFETDTGLGYRYVGGEWRLIPTVLDQRTLLSDTATVTFNNIPSTIKHLRVSWRARTTNAGQANEIRMRVNNVSSADYYGSHTTQVGTGITGFVVTAAAHARVGAIPGAGAQSGLFGAGHVDIPGWNNPTGGATGRLAWTAQSGFWDTASICYNETSEWLFVPNGPYTRIDMLNAANFLTGSQFTLEALA